MHTLVSGLWYKKVRGQRAGLQDKTKHLDTALIVYYSVKWRFFTGLCDAPGRSDASRRTSSLRSSARPLHRHLRARLGHRDHRGAVRQSRAHLLALLRPEQEQPLPDQRSSAFPNQGKKFGHRHILKIFYSSNFKKVKKASAF